MTAGWRLTRFGVSGAGLFTGTTRFDGATVTGTVRFDEATFTATTRFDEAAFTGTAARQDHLHRPGLVQSRQLAE